MLKVGPGKLTIYTYIYIYICPYIHTYIHDPYPALYTPNYTAPHRPRHTTRYNTTLHPHYTLLHCAKLPYTTAHTNTQCIIRACMPACRRQACVHAYSRGRPNTPVFNFDCRRTGRSKSCQKLCARKEQVRPKGCASLKC